MVRFDDDQIESSAYFIDFGAIAMQSFFVSINFKHFNPFGEAKSTSKSYKSLVDNAISFRADVYPNKKYSRSRTSSKSINVFVLFLYVLFS